jgi:hypothetical protein
LPRLRGWACAKTPGDLKFLPQSFVAGLVPAIRDLREPIVEVSPIGILVEDEPHFPSASPMLHISLPLSSRAHAIVMFGKYEPGQSVLFGKSLGETCAMFPGASGEVVCHADIEHAIGPVRHDVHPPWHTKNLLWEMCRPQLFRAFEGVGGRNKMLWGWAAAALDILSVVQDR